MRLSNKYGGIQFFAPGGNKTLTINFDSGIESVTYIWNGSGGGYLTDGIILAYNPNTAQNVVFTTTGQEKDVYVDDSYSDTQSMCGVAIIFKNGYELDGMSAEYIGPYTGIKYPNGTDASTVYGFIDSVNNSMYTLTITSKLGGGEYNE